MDKCYPGVADSGSRLLVDHSHTVALELGDLGGDIVNSIGGVVQLGCRVAAIFCDRRRFIERSQQLDDRVSRCESHRCRRLDDRDGCPTSSFSCPALVIEVNSVPDRGARTARSPITLRTVALRRLSRQQLRNDLYHIFKGLLCGISANTNSSRSTVPGTGVTRVVKVIRTCWATPPSESSADR